MFDVLKELIRFARTYRKFWIIPLTVFLVVVGSFVVLAESTALMPFIYALF